jgi:uncharacterized protein (TIGR03437 family)
MSLDSLRRSIAGGTKAVPFFVILVIAALAPAWAETLTYTLLPASGVAPAGREDGVIAYDLAGRQVFLFGGRGGAARDDLWRYSLDEGAWTEVQPSGPRPPARFGHTVLLDSRRRLIVFGGQAGGFFSDVWAYDIAVNVWQRLSPDDSGPNRRYGQSAIYDPARDRMIISHGFTDAGRFDDTWAFEFATNSWRNISPSAGRPLRRCLHHAAYDAQGDQMFLFGGCASGFGPCPLGDLWSFDLSTNQWRQIQGAPQPTPRQWYGLAFDAGRRRMIVFGGSGGGLLSDTWEFDPGTNAWSQAQIDGPAPTARNRHEGVYAEGSGLSLFFGGSTGTGLSSELWALGPPLKPQLSLNGVVNAFSYQGGPVAPGEIVSIFGSSLGPQGMQASLDPETNRLPTELGGVFVSWNGLRSPLYYVGAGQVNAQVPYELAGTNIATLNVTYNGISSEPLQIPVVPARPGAFPILFNQDGSFNSPDNAEAPGNVLVLYATGQGITTPPSESGAYPGDIIRNPVLPVTLLVGGIAAEILFSGQAPLTAGVIQINARLAPATPAGGVVPVVLRIGQHESQLGLTAAIR